MRRISGTTCFRGVLICAVIACSVFGQAPGPRSEMETLRGQADASAQRGDWSTAASLYQSAVAADPAAAWAHLGLADIYRANGAWELAADQYEAASSADPANTAVGQMASLSRQAQSEARAGYVKGATLEALARFSWSWALPSRDLNFQPVAQPATAQRFPVAGLFPRGEFALDSLSPGARAGLEELAGTIGKARGRILKIEVEGNTCNCRTDASNLELGRRQAETVRGFLISKRVAPDTAITAVSYGSSRPVVSRGAPSLPPGICDRDPIHSQNRRVVIVVYSRADEPVTPSPVLDVSFLSRRAGTTAFASLADGGQLHSGDEYRIRLRARAALYAYAFHLGSSGKWAVLFPAAPAQASAGQPSNRLGAGQDLSIPAADAGFVVSGAPGTEQTFVYSSAEPDQTLESLISKIRDGANAEDILPPVLPGSAPEPAAQIPQAKPASVTTPKRPGPAPAKASGVAHQPPAPAAPQPVEIHGSVPIMTRDVGRDLSAPGDLPRLPPNPRAYVRFRHL